MVWTVPPRPTQIIAIIILYSLYNVRLRCVLILRNNRCTVILHIQFHQMCLTKFQKGYLLLNISMYQIFIRSEEKRKKYEKKKEEKKVD